MHIDLTLLTDKLPIYVMHNMAKALIRLENAGNFILSASAGQCEDDTGKYWLKVRYHWVVNCEELEPEETIIF